MADFAKRSEIFTYLKVASAFHEFKVGVTELNDELNPQTQTDQFIMDAASTTSVDSYEPSFTFTGRVSKTDPVHAFIRTIGKELSVGADCETELVRFDGWEIDSYGVVAAKQYHVAVAVDYISNGEGGSNIEMSGTLHVQGDPIDGTFNTATKAFTATVE